MATASPNIPIVTLAELPALAAALAAQVRASGFRPDIIVYVETGARLPAAALCRALGLPAVPVTARRRGHGLKKILAPLAALLPRGLTNALRRAEERSGVHGRGGRAVTFARELEWRDRNILLVDDAADTGGTLRAVKEALVRRGADRARLRCAVLAATTPAGRAEVDFFVLDRNSVLPWSSDSPERAAAARLAQPPPAP